MSKNIEVAELVSRIAFVISLIITVAYFIVFGFSREPTKSDLIEHYESILFVVLIGMLSLVVGDVCRLIVGGINYSALLRVVAIVSSLTIFIYAYLA